MGSLYLRGKTYWMQYFVNGKPMRKSTRTTKKMIAKEVLLKVESDILQGDLPFTYFQKFTFEDLVKLIRQDYEINGKKLKRLNTSINNLEKDFSGISIPNINSSNIMNYIMKRKNAKAANATINRELSALKRMLNLGAGQTPPMVNNVVKIKMLEENNIREGFFEHHDFLAIRDVLPKYLYGVISFGYKFGWRLSEVTGLEWGQVDRKLWTVCIHAGKTKNKEPRLVYLDDELKEIFQDLWEIRKEKGGLLRCVFPNRFGIAPIKDFRCAWYAAFKEAKIAMQYFHDLRRSAVRNMIRAGIREKVAMQISGHKTRSVFDRYNIVDEKDLKNATERQEEYLKNY